MGKVKLGGQWCGEDKEDEDDRIDQVEVSVPIIFAAGKPQDEGDEAGRDEVPVPMRAKHVGREGGVEEHYADRYL